MNKTGKWICLLMALMMLLPMASCAAAEAPADDVIATVNGMSILRADADVMYDDLLAYYSYKGEDTSDPYIQLQIQQLAVQYLAQDLVVAQKSAELGLDVYTDEDMEKLMAEAQEEYKAIIEYYAPYYATDSTDAALETARVTVQAMLDANGMSIDDVVVNLKDTDLQNRIRAYAARDISVTDEEVQTAYEQQLAEAQEKYSTNFFDYELDVLYSGGTSLYTPDGMRAVRHILLEADSALQEKYNELYEAYEAQQAAAAQAEEGVDPEADAAVTDEPAATDVPAETIISEATAVPVTAEQVEEARQAVIASVQSTLDTIYDRLGKGEDFLVLVDEFNTDPGMTQEDTRLNGMAVRADSQMYDLRFTDAAVSIPAMGGVSEPAVSKFGVHIIEYLKDIPSGSAELTDELKESIKATLLSTLSDEKFDALLTEWLGNIDFAYSDAFMAELNAKLAEIEAANATEVPAEQPTAAPVE